MTITKNGSSRIELKKEQLAFLPLQLLFRSQTLVNSSSNAEKRKPGFALKWFVEDVEGSKLTENLKPNQEDWRNDVSPKYEQPFLTQMVQLARHLRMEQNMTRDDILEKVIRRKANNISFFKREGICSLDQIKSEYFDGAFSELASFPDEEILEGSATDEDVSTGFELFHAIVFCPSLDFKLFHFVDQLLSKETPRTIILTFINMFRLGIIKDRTTISLMKDLYALLASAFNLQYGKLLLATSTKSQLQNVIDNDWPFFTNYTHLVKMCLQGYECSNIQDIIKKIGNLLSNSSSHIYIYC